MSTDFKLTLDDTSLDNLPPNSEVLLSAAKELMGSVDSWKPGKTYQKGVVRTYSHKVSEGGPAWHCRVSEHGPEEGTFDQFWNGLGVDHTLHEKEYIPAVKKATLLKKADAGEIWSTYYTFIPPVSPRTFTFLITAHLEETSPRTGWIISIPVNVIQDLKLLAMQEKGIRGKYVSVETIKELENGKVEWRMATRSNAAGNIPRFLSEGSMDSKISEDVPHFLQWLKKREQKTIA